jgi:hypothetical protein
MKLQKTLSFIALSTFCLVTIPVGPVGATPLTTLQKYEAFVNQGVPPAALKRIFGFLKKSYGQKISVKTRQNKMVHVDFQNNFYAGVVDFTKPSNEKRFYLLDLKHATVERYYVSHGLNSGGKWAGRFSNLDDSQMSSLGLFLTGFTYDSKAFGGKAMALFGLDPSNNLAYTRNIVLHQSSYMTEEFMAARKADPNDTERMGRSFGCFAFDPAVEPKVLNKLQNGALIYSYTINSEKMAHDNPSSQEIEMVDPALDQVVNTDIELAQKENFKN